ncbi:ABC transporter permease [Variovorax saccharolyticus]|uniref:ABC transporter permease n=1 Tax=Variovorax saccharolyticus TaxID=3053516 RepID=UPI00257618DD|nr:ABC transporter permease [Variovorax sp. J22R187]MDM0021866.1 ABC transporter permease [Variovorax sp. J22R187]
MTFASLIAQLLNGLAGASTLFLLASGLSLIFGVSRIVNFAHGSLYMVGVYLAYSIVTGLGSGGVGFWAGLLLAALAVAMLGALIELVVLRRIYHVPELFQLLATFALALIIRDIVLAFYGPEEIPGPRAPGLGGAVEILGQRFPTYSLLLIVIGPVVYLALRLLLAKTRWGTLIRAATQDRGMVAALGVNQTWLFTSVFALGAFLAGLAGALQVHNEAASLALDVHASVDAFVVVVVGGLGSISGAYVAALIIAVVRALCAGLGTVDFGGFSVSFSQFTMAVDFVIMALILVVRPWGLMGRPEAPVRAGHSAEKPVRKATPRQKRLTQVALAMLVLAPLLTPIFPYTPVIGVELLIAALFATSLHLILGPGGMVSFGHAAYFGLAAYAAGLAASRFGMPILVAMPIGVALAALGATVFGWFSVRLSGVYMAMLTLAFAQLVWSIVYQWDSFTGGSNGLVGIWPPRWLGDSITYFYFTLFFVVAGLYLVRRVLFAGFGYAMRAGRDSALRSDAIGIDVKKVQWIAFIVAGALCGLAGTLFLYSKGSISPDALGMTRSLDGLVMVLLGGVQTVLGPVVGGVVFTTLQDTLARESRYWGGMLGIAILLLVQLLPQGLVGSLKRDRLNEAAS